MIVELYIAIGTVFLLHIYFTYYYFKNPKLPIISFLLLGASYILQNAFLIEINTNPITYQNLAETIPYTLIFIFGFTNINLLLFILNIIFWIYSYIARWKEWKIKR